jgi:hypothetical protein
MSTYDVVDHHRMANITPRLNVAKSARMAPVLIFAPAFIVAGLQWYKRIQEWALVDQLLAEVDEFLGVVWIVLV